VKQNPYLPGTPEEFIEQNMGLAQKVVWRYVHAIKSRPSGFEMDDIFGIACYGLIKAYLAFDPTRFEGENGGQVQFSTYAVPMIDGMILKHLRDFNSCLRPSRDSNEILGRLKALGLSGKESEKDLSQYLTQREIQKVKFALASREVDSLDREISFDNGDPFTLMNTLASDSDDFENIVLNDFRGMLDQRLKVVYELRFKRGLSQTEVAKAMGVSQVQVSRLERMLLELARKYGQEAV